MADSIVEALMEIRFKSADFPDLVPARLAGASLLAGWEIEGLPLADMPAPFRRADPSLAIQATLQAKKPDGSRLVRAGKRVLSYHTLAPYPGWVRFQTELRAIVDTLFESLKTPEVGRIGLRYINGFTQTAQGVAGTPDLNLTLEVAGVPLTGELNLNFRDNAEDSDILVRIATPSFVLSEKPDQFAVMMDIDVSTRSDFVSTDAGQVIHWLSSAHELLKFQFTRLIGDTERVLGK